MLPDDEAPALPQLARSRAERAASAVLPASGTVWTAAEIMHLAGFPGALDVSIATALSAAFAWGASGRWAGIPRRLPWWIAVAGGWLTLAVTAGPLHGWPYAPLTWSWAIASFIAWRKARRHPSVLDAQEWRHQRADWLHRSRRWGLGGSHLLEFERTHLGEVYEVSIKGTGKRATQIAGSPHIAELIAEDENLATVSRVQVKVPRPGRVRISVRREDPWGKPLLHPLADDDPEKIDLSGPYSITAPAKIGQDPATRRPLTVPLYDETGAKCIGITAIRGSGKTVVLDDLSEGVTRAPDALQIRINLSDKGGAEAESWGPACHLTAFGPDQKARAVKVLVVANGIIKWRTAKYKRGEYVPSPADPLIVVIIDESDSALQIAALRKQAEDVATKGREHGVTLVHVGQRGTADYSSAKIRSQDDVIVIGKVNRPGEVYHAAGSAGFTLPDMSVYGEGKPGVWGIAELGAAPQLGRAWVMGKTPAAHGAAVERIARERAFSQPELPQACREFLGEDYELLLSTDVFAQWAREQAAPAAVPAEAGIRSGLDSPLAPLAQAIRDGRVKADPETEDALLKALSLAEEDALRELDFDMDIDDETRAKLAAIDRKLDGTRRMLAETAAMPEPPEVSQEAMAAHTAARWGMVAEDIPPEVREQIIALLKGTGDEGMSGRKVVEALAEKFPANPPKRAAVMMWLNGLRAVGVTRLDGKGPAQRWKLTQGGDES